MEFNLDNIQLMTQKSMREFVRRELVPLGQELDELAEFPMHIYRQMVDLGVLDMTLPEERGGSGTDFLSFVVALEEFASDLAAAACKEAVQIHGGYGYVKDYAVERLYRDAVLTQSYTQANDAQRLQIAGQIFSEIK